MQYLDDEKTKEFAKLITKKDAVGIEEFNNRNPFYKEIYSNIKGRAYFDDQSQFSFVVSPDKKTAAFICLLKEPDPSPRASGYNLEMHVIKADREGIFHKSERIRYDYYDDLKFDELGNDGIILSYLDNPKTKIRRRLKPLAKELTMSNAELAEALIIEQKARKIQEMKRQHFQKKSALSTTRSISTQPIWNSVYIEL